MTVLDEASAFGARVAQRLQTEEVIWLTTVGPRGVPVPSPVWFLWVGGRFLIYSRPKTPKLRNIERSSHVSLNLNCSADGEDVVIFSGQASIEPTWPRADAVPAYLQKYDQPIERIGMTRASFAAAFSTAVLVTPTGLRGH